MKKILVSFVAIMAVASSAMAAETMNMHDQVNNAQAPAHQMQSTSEKSAVQGDSSKRLVRTVLIFTESSDQLSRATDRVPGLPASPGYVQ